MGSTKPLAALAAALGLALAACSDDQTPTAASVGVSNVLEQPSAVTQRTLLVSGIFEPDGRQLLRLNPAVVVPGAARVPAVGTRGLYVLEVTYADGSTSRVPFDALIAGDSDAASAEHGYFEVAVQLDGTIESARIVRTEDVTTIAEVPTDELGG